MGVVRRLLASLLCLVASGAWAQDTLLLSEDAESSALLKPAGHWDQVYPPTPEAPPTLSADAAHRGSGGLRFVDSNGASGSTDPGALILRLPSGASDLFLREWVRVAPVVGSGDFVVFDLKSGASNPADLFIRPPDVISVQGDSAVGWNSDKAQGVLQTDTWALVELQLVGLGTSAGSWRLWVNGTQRVARTGIAWGSFAPDSLLVGEPYANPGTFTGTVDFDDVRISAAQGPSTLALELATPSAATDDCIASTLTLRTSDGSPSPSPYAFDAALEPLDGGHWYTDATCRSSTETAHVEAGTTQTQVFVRFEAGGTKTLTASWADFLSAPATLEVRGSTKDVYRIGCALVPWQAPAGVVVLTLALRRRGRHRRQCTPTPPTA